MNANTLMPKEYISSADVFDSKGKPAARTATITGIKKVTVGQDDNKEEKPALTFAGTDRKLTLNKTNISALIEYFGEETDDWIGQAVTLVGDYTQYQGKTVKALRIRPGATGGMPLADETESFDPDAIPV